MTTAARTARRSRRRTLLDGEVVLLEGIIGARGADYAVRALLRATRQVIASNGDVEREEARRLEKLLRGLKKTHKKMRG